MYESRCTVQTRRHSLEIVMFYYSFMVVWIVFFLVTLERQQGLPHHVVSTVIPSRKIAFLVKGMEGIIYIQYNKFKKVTSAFQLYNNDFTNRVDQTKGAT